MVFKYKLIAFQILSNYFKFIFPRWFIIKFRQFEISKLVESWATLLAVFLIKLLNLKFILNFNKKAVKKVI